MREARVSVGSAKSGWLLPATRPAVSFPTAQGPALQRPLWDGENRSGQVFLAGALQRALQVPQERPGQLYSQITDHRSDICYYSYSVGGLGGRLATT